MQSLNSVLACITSTGVNRVCTPIIVSLVIVGVKFHGRAYRERPEGRGIIVHVRNRYLGQRSERFSVLSNRLVMQQPVADDGGHVCRKRRLWHRGGRNQFQRGANTRLEPIKFVARFEVISVSRFFFDLHHFSRGFYSHDIFPWFLFFAWK